VVLVSSLIDPTGGIVTVWLLVEDRGDEKEHLGLYRSPDAARTALSAMVSDAALDWLDGGIDSVTLAFVRARDRAGERPARAFQLYPLALELERDEAANEPARRETPSPAQAQVHMHVHGEVEAQPESSSPAVSGSLLLDGAPSLR
jgi:hypothetical protein